MVELIIGKEYQIVLGDEMTSTATAGGNIIHRKGRQITDVIKLIAFIDN